MRFKITVALLVISYLFLPISHSVFEVKKNLRMRNRGLVLGYEINDRSDARQTAKLRR